MPIDPLYIALIIVPLSMIIGIGASAIGFTAWVLIVPVFFVMLSFDLYTAIFISLLVDFANSLVMSYLSIKNKEVDPARALILILVSLPFIALGVYSGKFFIPHNQHYFKGSIGIVNFIIGCGFILKGIKIGRSIKNNDDPPLPEYDNSTTGRMKNMLLSIRRYALYPLGCLIGFTIGLFGIGGGTNYALTLMACLSFTAIKATGTAMVATCCSVFFAALLFFNQLPNAAHFPLSLSLLITGICVISLASTIIGARVLYSVSEERLYVLVGSVVIFTAMTSSLLAYAIK